MDSLSASRESLLEGGRGAREREGGREREREREVREGGGEGEGGREGGEGEGGGVRVTAHIQVLYKERCRGYPR